MIEFNDVDISKMKVSPSRMNQFFRCPYQWYLDKQDVSTIGTETYYSALGTLFHELVEKYYKALNMKLMANDKVTKMLIHSCFTNVVDTHIETRAQTKAIDNLTKNFIKMESKN